MEPKNNKSVRAVPTLKSALKLIGFKEIAANVYTIPPARKLNEYKSKSAIA